MSTKKLWLFALVWVCVVTVAGCASTSTQPQEMSEQDMSAQVLDIVEPTMEVVEPMAEVTQEVVENEQNQMNPVQSQKYIDYDPAAVDQALAEGKKVALFFHATRCPSCRALDKEINEDIDQLPQDSVTFKLDYDTQVALRKKYGVTRQHTIVIVDKNLEEIKKDAASANLEKLVSLLQ